MVEELKYDEDHKIIYHTIYTHNNEGQVESKTVFGEKKEFLEKVVFEHDNNGNVTRETHLNRKDKPINQVVYNYNENGELGEWYNSQYLMQSKYDEKGRLVYEETRNRGNNLVESFTDYKFDKDGILLESRSFTLGEQYQLEPGVSILLSWLFDRLPTTKGSSAPAAISWRTRAMRLVKLVS